MSFDARAVAGMAPFEPLVSPPGFPLELPEPFRFALPELPLPEAEGHCPLVVNFVATLDGAVRLSLEDPSSKAVALGSDHDWLLLGLLRALAATIVVGANPLRARRQAQNAGAALPGLSAELEDLRRRVGLGPLHHVVVTGSGEVPLDSGVWKGPATVVTTPAGAEVLAERGLGADVEVLVPPGDGRWVPAAAVVEAARRCTPARLSSGAPGLILAEPGPTLFAELLGEGWVDELFLTLSPLLAGPDEGRLDLLGSPARQRLDLVGLARAGSHLFARWRPAPSDVDPATR